MDRRRQNRFAAQLSVRVWGVDSSHLPFAEAARVKNISDNGMVIKGLTHPLRVGAVVEVQLEKEKSQFKVAWTSQSGAVGLVKLASECGVWKSHSACFAQAAGTS